MGSCVSKCYNRSPSNTTDDSSSIVQEKLVISESPRVNTLLSYDLSKTQTPSSSCSSLSASSPSVSSSSNSSSTSSSSSASISSFPRSSCAKENPRIAVLDPQKLKHDEFPVQTLLEATIWTTVRAPSKQPVLARGRQPFPAAKRSRSSSLTSIAGRKNFRTDYSSAVAPPNWKSNFLQPRHEVGIAGNVIAPQTTAGKDNIRPPTSYDSSRRPSSTSIEKETRAHQIQNTNEISYALTEDLNNPLISMDCFIFL